VNKRIFWEVESYSMKNFPAEAARFSALAASHFLADFFSSILPGILPAAMIYFHLDLKLGVVLLSAIGIGANLFQIPASAVDRTKSSPRFLILGIVLASSILLLPFLPQSTKLWQIAALLFLAGSGVALVHPLGLRGVHALEFSPKVSVPLFMTCGFFGAAVAPWASSLLVTHFGMKGLFFCFAAAAATILVILASKVRLLCSAGGAVKKTGFERAPWSFGAIFFFALALNCGTAILTGLLPTMLHAFGYALAFGGFCNMLFGIGSSSGSILLGVASRRICPQKLILPGLAIGIVLGIVYLAFAPNFKWAAVLVLPLGFLLSAPYPVLVALSASAPGKISASLRSGLIVGGTWGVAGIALLPAGQIAARFGLVAALYCALGCYAVVLAIALLTLRREK